MAELTFTARRDGPVGILTLVGEAHLGTVDGWHQAGSDLLANGAKHLLIDVSKLTFSDSTSMGALISLQNDFTAAKGRLILVGPQNQMRRAISAMGLSGHLHASPDEASARAQLLRK